MKTNKFVHPLARDGVKSGIIIFADQTGEHSFQSCVNDLTGDRMSWFDENAPTINDSLQWIRSVFVDVRNKCEVWKNLGDF